MATSRYLSGFQSIDGTLTFTLPLYSYEFTPSQELRPSDLWIAGRDFPLDLYANKALPLGNAEETAEMVSIPADDLLTTQDSNIDAMKQALYYGLQGYVLSTGADGTVRRALARIKAMPDIALSRLPYALPTSISWTRYSKWGVANAINNLSAAITVNATTWVVNNPGNANQDRLLITIIPQTATGITNPIITNETIGWQLATLRDMNATTQRIRFDTITPQLGYSTDSGVTFADDSSNLVAPLTGFAVLEAPLKYGNNTLRLNFTGSANVKVQVSGDSAYL